MQEKKTFKIKDLLLLILIAIPIGAIIGAIDALFGRVLLLITDFRYEHPYYLIPFLAIAGMLIAFCYKKFGNGTEKGMSLVFDVGNDKEKDIPLRLVPFIMIGTWLTHLFGGSAGREGVAVQIGATISHFIGKKLPIKNAGHILLVAGMASGFAGLFRTPIAAIFFAIEVLVIGKLDLKSLLPAVTGAFTAAKISALCGLEKFNFQLDTKISLSPVFILKLVLVAVIFGLVGCFFSVSLKWLKENLAKLIKNPIIKIGIIGVLLSIILLLLYNGRYAGLGTNLISASLEGEKIYAYDWIIKLLLTVITLSAGYQGGEVTPLFSIGASLGVVLGSLLGLPTQLVAALGYACVFGSATNTMIAPIFIGAEVFGFQYIPYFAITCIIAYFCNFNKSIYTSQIKPHKEK